MNTNETKFDLSNIWQFYGGTGLNVNKNQPLVFLVLADDEQQARQQFEDKVIRFNQEHLIETTEDDAGNDVPDIIEQRSDVSVIWFSKIEKDIKELYAEANK